MVEQGARVPPAKGLGRWLARNAPRSARGAVTVAIVSDAAMKKLNRRFRGVDKVTDVLSFAAEAGQRAEGGRQRAKSGAQQALCALPSALCSHLGEIVIARGMARRQAAILGHAPATELRILALHGLLHLLGYDHETDRGRMKRVEARLRRRSGLPPGLIARSS